MFYKRQRERGEGESVSNQTSVCCLHEETKTPFRRRRLLLFGVFFQLFLGLNDLARGKKREDDEKKRLTLKLDWRKKEEKKREETLVVRPSNWIES